MVTRLLFEGAALADLLARVRDEHGPNARIVSANRVRTGGIAGFFSREAYAITVEVDEPAPARPASARLAGSPRVDAPGTLLELADAINTAEAAETRVALSTGAMAGTATGARAAARGPVLSTDGPAFADILARWATSAPAKEETAPVAAPASVPPPAPVAPPAFAPPVRDDRLAALAALGVPAEVAARVAAHGSGGLWEGLVAALQATLPRPGEVDLRAGDVLVVAGPLPAALDLARTLAGRLRLDPASVLVAAPAEGPAGLEEVHRIPGPAAARRRAGALRRADQPTLVAVEASCDGASGEWARDVADALGARVAWAVVEASTKPADVADHLAALGRLDGIAVRGTAATRDPATILGTALDLDVPVVWLDDRPADAAAWATLLATRLVGGAQPGAGLAHIPGQRGRHRRGG